MGETSKGLLCQVCRTISEKCEAERGFSDKYEEMFTLLLFFCFFFVNENYLCCCGELCIDWLEFEHKQTKLTRLGKLPKGAVYRP